MDSPSLVVGTSIEQNTFIEMSSNASVLVGDARVEGGGDEDGFHTMARRRDSVRREESTLKKLGSDNVQGDLQKTKPKVVVFKA